MADAFGSEIAPGVLPDDKMYYNIAKRIIGSSLQYNYDLVGDYARDVQTLLNEQAGLSIKGIKPEINQDRIAGIINKISNYETFDQGKWLLDEPVVNFSQSVVDDTVKANADFQYKAGLRPKIIRTEAGNCCDWCKGLAGVYDYPNVPQDVYRRHRFCRCTVDYHPGDGKKQDVWSKKWKDPDKDDKIRERIRISKGKPKSTSNTVKNVIKRSVVKDEINKEKQWRHLKDNHLPGRSFINGDLTFSMNLYKEFKGKGDPIIVNGEWKNKERVNTKRVVATYVDAEGKEFDSTNIIIVYSKTGSHILGGRPDEP